jgi:hypothetical protein
MVWRWHQQPAFVEAMNKTTDIQVQSRVPLIDFSIQQRALDGSPKHIEAYLRMTGRWNDGGYGPPQPVGTPAEGGNQGVQVGSVTFVNVPISPTPQEADARRRHQARTSSRQRRPCRPCQFELLTTTSAADERRALTVRGVAGRERAAAKDCRQCGLRNRFNVGGGELHSRLEPRTSSFVQVGTRRPRVAASACGRDKFDTTEIVEEDISDQLFAVINSTHLSQQRIRKWCIDQVIAIVDPRARGHDRSTRSESQVLLNGDPQSVKDARRGYARQLGASPLRQPRIAANLSKVSHALTMPFTRPRVKRSPALLTDDQERFQELRTRR